MIITINTDTHVVDVVAKGKRIVPDLTPYEYEILVYLTRANRRVVSREEILKEIWKVGRDVGVDTRTVDQHVARLRRKVGPDAAKSIITVTNYGYKAAGVRLTNGTQPEGRVKGFSHDLLKRQKTYVTLELDRLLPTVKLGDVFRPA